MSTDWPASPDRLPPSRARRSATIYLIMGMLLVGLLTCGGAVSIFVIPQLGAARDSASQTRTAGQARAIGVALASYHARYQQFPSAYTVDANGEALLSWRVALLPFLGETKLHKQFDLNKPWDSPSNRLLLDKMPAAYRAAFSPVGRPSGETSFATIRDPDSVFPGGEPIKYGDCTREFSLTIAVVVAPEANVFWTKPDDIDIEQLYEALQGSPRPISLMLDGSVQEMDPEMTREAIQEQASRSG